jgi:glutathione synthase/RimK-type ligase-like ATP-grasp enzyme
MKKTCVILHSKAGVSYARKIGKEIVGLGYSFYRNSTKYFPNTFTKHPDLNPANTIIHSRVANFFTPNWMLELQRKVEQGYIVVNPVEVLKLTSDKYESLMMFGDENDDVYVPTTVLFDKKHPERFEENLQILNEKIVLKPRRSIGQGHYVETFRNNGKVSNEFLKLLNTYPTRWVVGQNFINFDRIYRVICLNGKSLPYGFVDRKEHEKDWKLSVCLNKQLQYVEKLSDDVRVLAESAQNTFGGVINFVDVFTDKYEYPILSEVNTACNLSIHEEKSGKNIAKEIAKTLVEVYME